MKTYTKLAKERDDLQSENETLRAFMDKVVETGNKLKADNEELKDRCNYIWAIGCDYDGANPNDATQMRQLADELVGIAVDGLEQTVFCNDEKTEIQPRKVKLCNLKMENAKLHKQLENSVQLLCKVGDTVYFNTYKNNATECIGVQPHKVESICVGYYVGNHTAIYDYDFGNSVFLTKPEALTRLAELGAENDRD